MGESPASRNKVVVKLPRPGYAESTTALTESRLGHHSSTDHLRPRRPICPLHRRRRCNPTWICSVSEFKKKIKARCKILAPRYFYQIFALGNFDANLPPTAHYEFSNCLGSCSARGQFLSSFFRLPRKAMWRSSSLIDILWTQSSSKEDFANWHTA